MKVFRIVYGGESQSPPHEMWMIVISHNVYLQPRGIQVWPDVDSAWIVDDTAITVTRPIIKTEEVGLVKRIWT